MYEKVSFHIKGIAPLLLHNGALADPSNQWSKAMKQITSKRKKVDADHAELKRLEFYGSLYLDDAMRPIVPSVNIEAMMIEAAKGQRLGEPFKAGLIVQDDAPIIYDGPKNADGLWDSGKFIDTRGVRVQMSRIMRTRPIFRAWELKFTAHFLPDVISLEQVTESVTNAGRRYGLGDFTPRFGRFEVAA